MNSPHHRRSLRGCWLNSALFPRTFLFGVLAALALVWAEPLRIEANDEHLRALVESDWRARDGGWSLAEVWEVIRRGQALLQRLEPALDSARASEFAARLTSIEGRGRQMEAESGVDPAAGRELWREAHRMVREIAFSNPLLRQIDKLLFLTRHDAGGVFHMVDQFYGFNAKPGGRLFVLMEPFGEHPRLVDLLEDSVVETGRLRGLPLEGGAFLSPEVSWDGETILFAWTAARGGDLEWSERASYHLFRVNADGSGLMQLTDGSWNDFDPCFLPSGRVAFVSERRGGYLRCGRHCPTYTLFGMDADGSDIVCLSYHETHEWQPSITQDGHLIYTRWDYVDRDTNIAHHPWKSGPDGGDPRPVHGNYPLRRESRPWMEMDIRAIPGSHRFVATAAAHHGHAFGSLVMIDPRVPDDGAESPLARLTPEVPFPEAEKHLRPIEQCMVYGTAWPLSEDDYLCVYDAEAKNRGVYWIDRFGNKELLYRDPAISCVSPIPLQARPVPPVIPDRLPAAAERAEASGSREAAEDGATIAVMNVYDSDFAWPEGVKIAGLRIIQVLPKTTPAPNEPRIGIAEQTNARAVLGVVPVEVDGSAYFEAPAGKAIYFQALGEDGLAVQSMRSVTYVHPGEQLTCQGCHEPRHRAPAPPGPLPVAMLRPPSKIEPEADGSRPFNFVRLVQPVLDRNCVTCHGEGDALDLRGVLTGKHGWTRSYAALAGRYGFYFHVTNGAIASGIHGGSRTTAGQFGAAAAPLMGYLDASHYKVQMSADERRRITLWLDCNSEFYGGYENIEAQARGEVVWPALE